MGKTAFSVFPNAGELLYATQHLYSTLIFCSFANKIYSYSWCDNYSFCRLKHVDVDVDVIIHEHVWFFFISMNS